MKPLRPTPNWLDRLADQDWRAGLGRRFEALTDEVYRVLRWATLVGFARFFSQTTPSPAFSALVWVLSFFLFGSVASRFLLRPEIQLFPATAPLHLRLLQFLFNFTLCVIVFVLVLWGLDAMVNAMASYRLAR